MYKILDMLQKFGSYGKKHIETTSRRWGQSVLIITRVYVTDEVIVRAEVQLGADSMVAKIKENRDEEYSIISTFLYLLQVQKI